MTLLYIPIGGYNYSTPVDEGYATLDEAAAEWARRRNDWTGRFPCWGDGLESESVVILADETEVREAWTLDELEHIVGEREHYFDA